LRVGIKLGIGCRHFTQMSSSLRTIYKVCVIILDVVKDLFGTGLTESRYEELSKQLCKPLESVLVNSDEKSCNKLGIGEGTRNVITRYPMRSLMKPAEQREPTITNSGM